METSQRSQPMGKTEEGRYRAFLLRCWQEPGVGKAGEAAWRFTLVKVGDGKAGQKGFASLEDLVRHLRRELEVSE